MNWLPVVLAVLVLLAGRVLFLRFKPFKACSGCNGRGHCVRCQYTGKVLRLGAGLVHPELRRKRRV